MVLGLERREDGETDTNVTHDFLHFGLTVTAMLTVPALYVAGNEWGVGVVGGGTLPLQRLSLLEEPLHRHVPVLDRCQSTLRQLRLHDGQAHGAGGSLPCGNRLRDHRDAVLQQLGVLDHLDQPASIFHVDAVPDVVPIDLDIDRAAHVESTDKVSRVHP